MKRNAASSFRRCWTGAVVDALPGSQASVAASRRAPWWTGPVPPPVPGAGRLRGTLRAKQTGLELDAVRGTAKAEDLIEGRSSPDRFVES